MPDYRVRIVAHRDFTLRAANEPQAMAIAWNIANGHDPSLMPEHVLSDSGFPPQWYVDAMEVIP